jgi:Mg-chelatase subunit ChlD
MRGDMKRAFMYILLIAVCPVCPLAYAAPRDEVCHYGLVIDSSLSMRPRLQWALESAGSLIEGKGALDAVFIVTFDQHLELIKDMTTRQEELLEALRYIIPRPGLTRLLDAVALSAEHLVETDSASRCRALVVITDGDEGDSRHRLEGIFQRLGRERLRAFFIAFPDVIPKEKGSEARKDAVELIERMAKGSGGKAWFPQTESDLIQAADEILSLLRAPVH